MEGVGCFSVFGEPAGDDVDVFEYGVEELWEGYEFAGSIEVVFFIGYFRVIIVFSRGVSQILV